MRRPGYNPTRRNRNIGTSKAGRGQNNRLVIPSAWTDDRMYYERLVRPVVVPIQIHSVSAHILVEPPQSGFLHACTVEDILHVLHMIPHRHLTPIKLFVLRQPKRKERILTPVWGRLVYWARIGSLSGPAVFLEAQKTGPLKWHKSLDPEDAMELDRLRQDGHPIEFDKRTHVLHTTLDSIRSTQLYRTLPHEIGHYVDFLESVEEPAHGNSDQWQALNDRYHARPSQERESFAHRYADNFRNRSIVEGSFPFPRILDEESIARMGLRPEWFLQSTV